MILVEKAQVTDQTIFLANWAVYNHTYCSYEIVEASLEKENVQEQNDITSLQF